jgi:hypothetical protein
MEIQIVNAIIDGTIDGNPEGFLVAANNLSAARKLKVSRKVDLADPFL